LFMSSNWHVDDEDGCMRELIARGVDGIVVFASRVSDAKLQQYARQVPIVATGRRLRSPGLFGLQIDDRHGATLAVRHLLELGHRRIAFIAGSDNHPDAPKRLAGYKMALQDAGIRFNPRLVTTGDWHEEGGLRATLELLDANQDFTALLCVNDQTAYGAFLGVFRNGLAVPRDISVVGFDDLSSAAYQVPPLTSVRQSARTLGEQSARAVLELLAQGRPRLSPVRAELIVRESTAVARCTQPVAVALARAADDVCKAESGLSLHSSNAIEALAARFPTRFLWGVASSAFQIEGATSADGRGPSIWDEFCRRPGATADGSDGQIACDHYNRVESDLDLIAALGVQAYRLSISWPRIQPTGYGPINTRGLDFYDRLIDGLLERKILPFVTLYHWDLPAALQRERNGWADRDTAYRFADYAALVASHFSDRVRSFCTHNEPWVTATIGHELGHFAPGVKNRGVAMQVSHHCLLSHGLATQAIRSSGENADVGIVLNLSHVSSATDSPADKLQAFREEGLLVRWYLDALLRGNYPSKVIEYLGAEAPKTCAGDASLIAQPLDFLGVNYYHPIVSTVARPYSPARTGAVITDMGWQVAPSLFTEVLVRLDRDYDLPPILITENGAAYRDTVERGGVHDEDRRAYIESHLRAVAAAIERGVDIRGYFVWSLLDNFEWAQGYSKRFGLYYVDYPSQTRILKRSGLWYKDFATAFHRTRA
jgi:beta-glucosidase